MVADATSEVNASAPRARVFICYSRNEMKFADRLDVALYALGFGVRIDRRDIAYFRDWWPEIQTHITWADTVMFVISPDSVTSPVCKKELQFAASLNKRIAPLVYRR